MYTSLNKKDSLMSSTQKNKPGSQTNLMPHSSVRTNINHPALIQFSDKQVRYQPNLTTSLHTTPLTGTIQKQSITDTEARNRLNTNMPEFSKNSLILQPWDDDWKGSNCHGYTYSNTPGCAMDAETFLLNIPEGTPISLFFRGTNLAHSGIYSSGTLTHLLIGIGILQTTSNGTETFGYDLRFNLPEDLDAFQEFIAPIQERTDKINRVRQVTNTFSTHYQNWLSFFESNEDTTDAAFNHIYDIKDSLEDNVDVIDPDQDDQFLQMEERVRTFP